MRKPIFRLMQAVCMMLLFAIPAAADDFHYNNVLIGDRASGMGGAYTAISDDAAGLYYNPAGIAYASGRNLSASVNAFYNLTKKYEKVIDGNPWERKSSALLPNYFGIVQPTGKFTFGFSYAVPDTIHENQDQIFYNLTTASRVVINFNNDDNTYNIGPSIAFELTKNVSAGMTLYLHQRRAQVILNQLINDYGTGSLWTNIYIETKEQGFRPILGFMWSPAEKLSLGFTVSKIMLYDSETTIQGTCIANPTAPECLNPPSFNSVSFDAKRKYPLQIAVGAAYFASKSLLLSADATYSEKVTDADFGGKVSVLNVALGAEYYLNRDWAVRGGLFTNMANTPVIDPTKTNQREHIDLYGMSMSIGRFTRNTSVSLGGIVSYGTGEAQIYRDSTVIQDAEIFAWTVFLSSSYSY